MLWEGCFRSEGAIMELSRIVKLSAPTAINVVGAALFNRLLKN